MVDLFDRVPGSWLGWGFIACVLLGLLNGWVQNLPHHVNPYDACVARRTSVAVCVDQYWRYIGD